MTAKYLNARVISFGDLVTDTGAVQLYPLGTRREEDGSTYRYVKRDDSTVAFASGDLVYRDAATTAGVYWEVSGDVSDHDPALVAGVARSSIADAGFGWILTKGVVTNLKKKNGTAAYSWRKGDVLIPGAAASQDGYASRVVIAASTKVSAAELAAALERPIGWAVATATNSATSGSAIIELE